MQTHSLTTPMHRRSEVVVVLHFVAPFVCISALGACNIIIYLDTSHMLVCGRARRRTPICFYYSAGALVKNCVYKTK